MNGRTFELGQVVKIVTGDRLLDVAEVSKVWVGGKGYTTKSVRDGEALQWNDCGGSRRRGWSIDTTHIEGLAKDETKDSLLKVLKAQEEAAAAAKDKATSDRKAAIAAFWQEKGKAMLEGAQTVTGFFYPVRALVIKRPHTTKPEMSEVRMVLFMVEDYKDDLDESTRVRIEFGGYCSRGKPQCLMNVSSFFGQTITAPTIEEAFYDLVRFNM